MREREWRWALDKCNAIETERDALKKQTLEQSRELGRLGSLESTVERLEKELHDRCGP